MLHFMLSHKYGGDPANLNRAQALVAALNEALYPHASVIAPWIELCREWHEDPEKTAIGSAVVEESIRRSDGVIHARYITQPLSAGQVRERDMAGRAGKPCYTCWVVGRLPEVASDFAASLLARLSGTP